MSKILKSFLIALLITAWIFSGWPQIWQNPRIPPKIQEAYLSTGLLLTAILTFAILAVVNPPRPKVRLSAGFLFW